MKTLKELEKEYEHFINTDTMPDPIKFPRYAEGTIIDENKSVKWNRNEVTRINTLWVEECHRLVEEHHDIKLKLLVEIEDAVRRELSDVYSSEEISNMFWFANENSSDWKQMFKRIYEYIELLIKMRS